MQIPIRLEYEGESIRRMFFYFPDLQNLTVSYNWRAQIVVRFALQLAAIITDTVGINFSLFEQHSVQRQILHDLYAERNGMQKMTVDTISENVRRWLSFKGFLHEQDIVQLQRLGGGSIPQSIHMLFVSIPKIFPKKRIFKNKASYPRPFLKSVYQRSDLEAIRALYLAKRKERDESWAKEKVDATNTYAQEDMSDGYANMASITELQDDKTVEGFLRTYSS